MKLEAGQAVYIEGPPGAAVGQVIAIARPSQLPNIAGAPPAGSVRAILEETGARYLLWLTYRHPDVGMQITFVALVYRDGRIRDLHGQQLTVLPIVANGRG